MKALPKSVEQTCDIAETFLSALEPNESRATVVGLQGELGAGKTAFAKCIAEALGIEEPVTSPTFVIEKIYSLGDTITKWRHLIHIDAYRIESGDELVSLGWEEIEADPQNLILIEWPERVSEILPEGHRLIHFTFVDETTRKIAILGNTITK